MCQYIKITYSFRILTIVLVSILCLWISAEAGATHAASGTVYSCDIQRNYKHPVTGAIEDQGGEAAYATGQGMVEGAVQNKGMLEVTDGGQYYLTFRMNLMDYTKDHSFWVQKKRRQ